MIFIRKFCKIDTHNWTNFFFAFIIRQCTKMQEGGRIINKTSSSLRNFVLISQLGLHIIITTLVSLYFGYCLDMYFKTSVFIFVFLILGILAGANLAYKTLKKAIQRMQKEEEKLRREQMEQIKKNLIHVPKQKSRVFKEDTDGQGE